tara:strand:+ start:1178 stop:1408 length:231 start_codon:yes stop_codon:yes gene_type:complete
MKQLMKNWLFWSIIANVILVATIIIMAVVWNKHECPIQEPQIITEKHLQQIKRIGNAETKNDIDSLLIELYNFGSK